MCVCVHSSLNLNKFSDYIREHGIDAAMAKYHMSRNTGYSPRRRDNFNGTITKSERGIQS